MLRTERLNLRPALRGDVASLFDFLGDAEAMKFTHVDDTLRECQRRVMVHEWRRRRDSCAPWVVTTRNDGRVVGWGGLYQDPFDPGWGFEVGYYFHPDVWGRGYASELVGAALQVADQQLKLPEVWAMAHPQNPGSRRVLEKAGFEVVRYIEEKNRFLFRRPRSLISHRFIRGADGEGYGNPRETYLGTVVDETWVATFALLPLPGEKEKNHVLNVPPRAGSV